MNLEKPNSIRFNIAGAFGKSDQLLLFFTRNKEVLNKFDITVYDGINSCSWNGGRINRDIVYKDSIIEFYYRNGINIALTFTNPVIDFGDKLGNELLEKFHRDGNCIISANTEFTTYVNERFPKYKHTRSITSFGKINVPMQDEDVEKYKLLEKIYDYIVPRSEHIFDKRFKNLDMSKYEILINDTCVYNCPYYGEHFEKIAEQNRLYKRPWSEGGTDNMREVEECWIPTFNPDVGHQPTIEKYGDDYGMDLSLCQIKRLINRGINNFKISGREMTYEDYEVELNTCLKEMYEAAN